MEKYWLHCALPITHTRAVFLQIQCATHMPIRFGTTNTGGKQYSQLRCSILAAYLCSAVFLFL